MNSLGTGSLKVQQNMIHSTSWHTTWCTSTSLLPFEHNEKFKCLIYVVKVSVKLCIWKVHQVALLECIEHSIQCLARLLRKSIFSNSRWPGLHLCTGSHFEACPSLTKKYYRTSWQLKWIPKLVCQVFPISHVQLYCIELKWSKWSKFAELQCVVRWD